MATVRYKCRFNSITIDLDTDREAKKNKEVSVRWNQLLEHNYPEFKTIYTGGSKSKIGTAAVAVCSGIQKGVSALMDPQVTIMVAEVQATRIAIRMAISTLTHGNALALNLHLWD